MTSPNTDIMDLFQAEEAFLNYVYTGVIGPTEGKTIGYELISTTRTHFTYWVSFESLDEEPQVSDRYRIKIDRRSGELSVPEKIEITDEEMRQAIFAATGDTVATSSRFTDGEFSISYKVTVMDKPDTAYIVQMRHHGFVASMDALMKFVDHHNKVKPDAIPMPAVYSIPGEAEHQEKTGFGRQITEFIPGVLAETVYPQMPHSDKLQFVRKMALAWQGVWNLPIHSSSKPPHGIGELSAEDRDGVIRVYIGPDRHSTMGDQQFTSVREWLKARIRCAVDRLDRAEGIDDYKKEYMAPIRTFVDTRLDQVPETVEECPITALHIDMGLHNVIVSADDHKDIKAIIDWEFTNSAPFLAAYDRLDEVFRYGAPNGFGTEYAQADELRSAFWDTIPKWKAHWESQGTKDFMEWFRFGRVLQPQCADKELSMAEKKEFWAENIRVVEGMLKKYGGET